MSSATATERLTGKALLTKLKEIPDLKRSDKARACGYVVTKHGKERAQLSEFLEAILAAKGIEIDPAKQSDSRGREARYRTSVQKSGVMIIGKSYTEKMGLKAGDEFTIKLGYKHIQLQQVEEE